MAPDPLPTAFGLGLAGLGAAALAWHRRGLDDAEDRAARGELEDWQLNFHRARHRRRRKVAGLLIFLGAAIPAGDAALAAAGPDARPWFLAYVGVLLWAVSGLILLAALDWWATALHLRDRLADVRARRVALEYELRRVRDAHRPAPRAPAEGSADEPPRRPARNRLREYHFGD